MAADGILHVLPEVGAAHAVGEGGLKGDGIAHLEVVLEVGDAVAAGSEDDGLGADGGTGSGTCLVDAHHLGGHLTACLEGRGLVHLQLYLVGIVEGVVGVVDAVVVDDEGIEGGEAVDAVGLDLLTVDRHGHTDVGRSHQRLILGGDAKGGLIAGGGVLLGVGGAQVLLIDLLGGPDLAVDHEDAAGDLQHLLGHRGAAVDGGHPEVAVDGGQDGLTLMGSVVVVSGLVQGLGVDHVLTAR